jgi:hypothetical protein
MEAVYRAQYKTEQTMNITVLVLLRNYIYRVFSCGGNLTAE